MRIGIGVPTRNRPYHLPLLLSALLRQDHREWDLVIVNDWDREEDLLEHPKVTKLVGMMREQGHEVQIAKGIRRGPPFAHNIAMRSLSHDLILRIDDDQFPQPDFLTRLCEPFLQDSEGRIGAVGGVYPPVDYTISWAPAAERHRRNLSFAQPFLQLCWHKNNSWYLTDSLHSSFLYRREAVEKAGGFPECYSEAGSTEETDTSLRIRQAGYWLLVVTGAVAWHFMSETGGLRDLDRLEELRRSDDQVFKARFNGIDLWKVGGGMRLIARRD